MRFEDRGVSLEPDITAGEPTGTSNGDSVVSHLEFRSIEFNRNPDVAVVHFSRENILQFRIIRSRKRGDDLV